MFGLIDSVALAPPAAAAALLGGGIGVRAGLTVVAVAGVAAAGLLVALPRSAGSERALRFQLGRWLSPRTISRRRLSEAWALVSACWLLRALASFLLLGTLAVGFSFPLALLLLCAGAAAGGSQALCGDARRRRARRPHRRCNLPRRDRLARRPLPG